MKSVVIDSNIPLIASGQIGEALAVIILEKIANNKIKGITDVLFIEEILDNFSYLKENNIGKIMFKSFKNIINKILPLTLKDFELSSQLFLSYPDISPRDLIHAAIMINNDQKEILSIDGPKYHNINQIKRSSFPELLNQSRAIIQKGEK